MKMNATHAPTSLKAKDRNAKDHANQLRAPLVNILGLIELLENNPAEPIKSEVIQMLRISAAKLDTATRIVIQQT
jgi:hypothetical protein